MNQRTIDRFQPQIGNEQKTTMVITEKEGNYFASWDRAGGSENLPVQVAGNKLEIKTSSEPLVNGVKTKLPLTIKANIDGDKWTGEMQLGNNQGISLNGHKIAK